MNFRVQRTGDGDEPVIFTVSGWIQAEQAETLRELIGREERRVALDLKEVVLIDRDAVRFLAHCEITGVELRDCPAFVREWIRQERAVLRQDGGAGRGAGDT